MFMGTFGYQDTGYKHSNLMDEEPNTPEACNKFSEITFVNEKVVSCIEKSNKKMVTFQNRYSYERQNDLAVFDKEISQVKETLNLFDLVLDKLNNKEVPAMILELNKIQGQFELSRKDNENVTNLNVSNKEMLMKLFEQVL